MVIPPPVFAAAAECCIRARPSESLCRAGRRAPETRYGAEIRETSPCKRRACRTPAAPRFAPFDTQRAILPVCALRAYPARRRRPRLSGSMRSEEHTSELQSRLHLVCRLLLEKKKKKPSMSSCIYSVRTADTLCDVVPSAY